MLLQEADSGLPSSFCWYRTQALRRLLLRSVMQTIQGAEILLLPRFLLPKTYWVEREVST